eukprot:GHUV01026761.1.p1 GENE.GHUV01026761.1~~GHUV01026761.1.p1  ORF type:complete len:270 (+),score=44.20 GHUV01026761.1:1184-1993(+)
MLQMAPACPIRGAVTASSCIMLGDAVTCMEDVLTELSGLQYHKYNSMEKPHRSAMRNSLDTPKSETYSRRSSTGLSNVGFSVSGSGEHPEAEHNRPTHIAGADSISLKKIIDMFYEKVVADPKIGHFFVGIDMIKLKRHQVRTMALAFGGKELVNDEDPNMDLRKIHIHLIRDKKLDLVRDAPSSTGLTGSLLLSPACTCGLMSAAIVFSCLTYTAWCAAVQQRRVGVKPPHQRLQSNNSAHSLSANIEDGLSTCAICAERLGVFCGPV